MAKYTLSVNGHDRAVDVPETESLLTVLRHELNLTAAKYGCGEGQCGACTVLLDGQAVRACVTRVGAVQRRAVQTLEGLAEGTALHHVQQAFVQQDAMQCGYCTSGMIMSAVALLARQPSPTDEQIIRAMNGNICRCGSHPRILEAVRRAAATDRSTR